MAPVADNNHPSGRSGEETDGNNYTTGQRSRQQPGSANAEGNGFAVTEEHRSAWHVRTRAPNVSYVRVEEPPIKAQELIDLYTDELQSRLQEQNNGGDGSSTSTLVNESSPEHIDNDDFLDMEMSMPPQKLILDIPIPSSFGDLGGWSPSMEDLGFDTLDPNFMCPTWLTAEPAQSLAPIPQQQRPPPSDPSLSFGIMGGMHQNSMICNDLDQLFFDRVYSFAPIISESRYMSWSKRLDKTKPQICLQYAMWTLAASLSSQFQYEQRSLYTEARQLLVALEAENEVNHINPTSMRFEQVQAWILLVIYELTNVDCNYQRGILSAGRALRLVQMTKLYDIDGQTTFTGDWVEQESMRRTFWLVYTMDRFTSAIDRLPLTFNERQIRTRLPAPEDNFSSGRPVTMPFLSDMMDVLDSPAGGCCDSDKTARPFTTSIIIATICGRALQHGYFLPYSGQHQQPSSSDYGNQFQWAQSLDALLDQHIMSLTNHVSVASGRPDPMFIFVGFVAHMANFILSETIPDYQQQMAQHGGNEGVLAEHKSPSLDIVHKFSTLATTLGELHQFRVCYLVLSSPVLPSLSYPSCITLARTSGPLQFPVSHNPILRPRRLLELDNMIAGRITFANVDPISQIHPLTPIPLLLSARFCMSRSSSGEARKNSSDDTTTTYSTLLLEVHAALARLSESNGLARMCLERLNNNTGTSQEQRADDMMLIC
ncbi:hypothetical protein G7054_g1810 [Neopestalotiopsis clavispora]|nr:hypothetical protein G7054_g1810 [Neopestalotiopsis clavispora]